MTTTEVRTEYRSAPFEIRAAGDESSRDFTIPFARFNVWNEIYSWFEGRFLERLIPGAFEGTFDERGDVIRFLFDHGHDPAIGVKPLGSVPALRETTEWPEADVTFIDRPYADDIRAGLLLTPPIYGASYRFGVIAESWDEEPGKSDLNPDGIPERTITRLRMAELSITAFPADEGTNGLAAVRSLNDRYIKQDRVDGEPVDPTRPARLGADTDTTRAQIATAFALARRRY